ncbi:MAG: hypothetical protein J0I41_04760 [Filimonas sp.]|nr:hypothetical protein [Filimonas sp.]
MILSEWQSASFEVNKNKLTDFVNYLSSVWQNRNRYVVESPEDISEEEQQEEKIQRQRFFDFTIDGKISARNYVGVVQFEDTRIEVYPKIFSGDNTASAQLWQQNLLYWLGYCRKIKFPFSQADISKFASDDFLELLIYIFANYTEEIIANQPFQAYQSVEEETTFLKGRLSFDNYTKHNLITGKWQHFYCIHEPFVYDNQFNRIVKYVAKRLTGISSHQPNVEKLNSLLFLLHDVADVACIADDCDKVKLNPLFEDHKQVLALCKLYLSSHVIDIHDESNRNFCFLVPMEYVFEEFIFGFITTHFPALNVKSQSTDFLALNQDNKVFQIKNDLYIPNNLIIDTKYKIRSVDDGPKAGVSQNDMYQMISYSLRRNCERVLLLYPEALKSKSLNTPVCFTIPSAMLSKEITIRVCNIDIKLEDMEQADILMSARMEEALLKDL